MNIELFYTVGCQKCADAREGLKVAAFAVSANVEWREINVLEELDYAVELGVLNLPALAIDRKLVFSSLPTPAQLTKELKQRLAQESPHGH